MNKLTTAGEPQAKVAPSKSSRKVGNTRMSRKVEKGPASLVSVPVRIVSGRGTRIDWPPGTPRKLKMFQLVVTCIPWSSVTTHSKVTLVAFTSLATTVLVSGLTCETRAVHNQIYHRFG